MPNFSPEAYVELVAELLEKKYEVRGLHDADPNRAHLILRHDVDFDLTAAVQMAELESANGWSAQYFVLVRSEFYNLYSKHSSTALLRLVELGHGVGLHFGARLYPPPRRTIYAKGWRKRLTSLSCWPSGPSTFSVCTGRSRIC